ncbi:MAG TPA: glycerol-3-phosphate 1-O-acyltransferase PlsY [Burkholderiaceae bacterium]|nr:glycerol-3-phosphate 1-O-acyltransferase PlsY [Burkholderiaceae bacterium]
MTLAASLCAVVLSYLIGSVSFAVVVSRTMGMADPRTYGSGNPGATNVLRSGNKTAAILTLLGDLLKGLLAVLAVKWFAARYGYGDGTVAMSALAVFAGHLFPVFHRFKGGKGVATAAGVLMAIHPAVGGATLLTWLIIAFFFRLSSLAALVSAVFAPLWYGLLFGVDALAVAIALMSGLLIWRHSANIANLMAGRESRIGQKKT